MGSQMSCCSTASAGPVLSESHQQELRCPLTCHSVLQMNGRYMCLYSTVVALNSPAPPDWHQAKQLVPCRQQQGGLLLRCKTPH